ncbi:MAG: hypothetical protein HY280_03795 [Nitrospinae bacterium]|nr:hypothetical protein [Nitrospinota bacterium]
MTIASNKKGAQRGVNGLPRRYVIILGALIGLLIPSNAALAGPPDPPTQWILQLNDNGAYYSNDLSPRKSGGQNLAYSSLAYVTKDWGITLLGSYADTTYNYGNPGITNDFHLASFLDSSVSTYYKLPKLAYFETRLGVDANLPTGHAGLSNREVSSLFVDNVIRELVPVPSFGRGLNIIPNVVVSADVGKLSTGLGIRYEITGAYNPTPDVPNSTYDPGDTATYFASMLYNHSERAQTLLDLSAIFSTRDKQGGKEVFLQGTAYSANWHFIRTFEVTRLTFGASYGWQEKNQSYDGAKMTTEDSNTNGNTWEGQIIGLRQISKTFYLNGSAGLKTVVANGYDKADALYDPGYQKVYVGCGFTKSVSTKLSWTVNLNLFQLWNGTDWLEPVAAVYRGGSADVGFVYTWN